MNDKFKKLTALLLALAMLATCVVPKNAYAKTTKTQYVTRAYVLQQVEKLIGATETTADIKKVKDVKKSSSYYTTMSIALNAGLVKPDSSNKLYPTRKATKKYVATVLARVSESTTSKVLGKRNPKALLTKTTLNKMLKSIYPNVVTKSNAKIGKGNVVINKPVTLSDATITGDLVIGDGVADKEVTLNNVIVKGKVIVRGGGENSIIITGTSDISNIIIRQVNNKVSLKVKGDAQVKMVYINDGSNDVNIVGQVGTLNVVGKNLTVTLTDASVNTLTVSEKANKAVIITDEKSTVKEATLNAAGAEVKGEGKVETVNVNANDTVVTVKNDKINTKDDVTPPKTSEDDANTNTDNATTEDSSSSSGGGATSGGDSGNAGGGSTSGGDGGNSGGGSTSGGSTEEKYVTDERFAEGYPKVETDKEKGTVTVSYKLDEGVASETTPAKIYNLVSSVNTQFDATTESVIHGHMIMGYNENHTIYTQKCDYFEITDDKEYSKEYTISINGVMDGLVVYSVIDCNGVKSAVPTRELFDEDAAESTVRNSIFPACAIMNQSRDQVYIYYYAKLDMNSKPDANVFTFTCNGENINPSITIDEMRTEEMSNYNDNQSYIKLSLTDPLPKGRVCIKYTTPESGAKIQNTLGIASSDYNILLEEVETQITEASVSADGKNVKVVTPICEFQTHILGQTNVVDNRNQVEVYVDDVLVEQQKITLSTTASDIRYEIILDTPFSSSDSSHTITVKAKDGCVLYNAAGEELNNGLSVQKFTYEKVLEWGTPVYKKSADKPQIMIPLSSAEVFVWDILGCGFVLKVGDKEYRLRGNASLNYSQNSEGEGSYNIVITDFSGVSLPETLDETSSMQIKYEPLSTEQYGSGRLEYSSGKYVASTGYMNITIEQ